MQERSNMTARTNFKLGRRAEKHGYERAFWYFFLLAFVVAYAFYSVKSKVYMKNRFHKSLIM